MKSKNYENKINNTCLFHHIFNAFRDIGKEEKKVVSNTGESFKDDNNTISILNYSINNLDKLTISNPL